MAWRGLSEFYRQLWESKLGNGWGIWLVVAHPSEKYEFVRVGIIVPNIWKHKKCSKSATRNKLEGNWEQRTTSAVKAAPWTWERLEQIVLLHKVFGVFLASQHKGCHFQGIGVQPQIWFRSLLSIQYIHVQYTQKLWFSQTLFLGILNLRANSYNYAKIQ